MYFTDTETLLYICRTLSILYVFIYVETSQEKSQRSLKADLCASVYVWHTHIQNTRTGGEEKSVPPLQGGLPSPRAPLQRHSPSPATYVPRAPSQPSTPAAAPSRRAAPLDPTGENGARLTSRQSRRRPCAGGGARAPPSGGGRSRQRAAAVPPVRPLSSAGWRPSAERAWGEARRGEVGVCSPAREGTKGRPLTSGAGACHEHEARVRRAPAEASRASWGSGARLPAVRARAPNASRHGEKGSGPRSSSAAVALPWERLAPAEGPRRLLGLFPSTAFPASEPSRAWWSCDRQEEERKGRCGGS